MRKPFTTTIDADIQQRFKLACVTNNAKMNDVLEAFMVAYISGDYSIQTETKLFRNQK